MSVSRPDPTRAPAKPPSSTLIEGIERVDLRVQDVDRALSFYRDVAGLHVIEHLPTKATLGASGGPALLALDSEDVDAPADRTSTGLYHTAFRYPDRPALGDALARLARADYEIGVGDHGVSEALYVDDPDGYGVELYRDRPRDQWPAPRPGERVHMGTGPIDLQDLLADGNTPGDAHTTAPGGTDVGHVHLQVSDLDETIDFYSGAMGLDLMMALGNQAGFFSSHGYHHHVGANTWHSRGRGPAPRTRAGLERVILRASSVTELRGLEDRMSSRGHDVSGDDNELILHDPDGIEIHLITV
ncbi:MAG: VOC family protein [Actinomycetota bacterium]